MVWPIDKFMGFGSMSTPGPPGADGTDATITIGTVTDVPYGTPPAVTNVGTPGAAIFDFELETGPGGAPGLDGDDAYVYIAFASDASGTDFTLTFDPALNYIAILTTDTIIVSPVVGDFAGLWKNYKGAKGDQGDPGEVEEAPIDGTPYARQDADWVATGGGGGDTDVLVMNEQVSAPSPVASHGQLYVGPANYIKSLLHFNGADDSTTFTDESGKTWTRAGDACLKTAGAKFGSAGGYFDGTGDWITTPQHSDFDFGYGDFTIDGWMNTHAVPNVGRFAAAGNDSDGNFNQWFLGFGTVWGGGTKLNWAYRNGGYVELNSSALTYTIDTMAHVAVVRYKDIITLYFKGVPVGTQNVTGIPINCGSAGVIIGARYTSVATEPWTGYLDEFCFCKGFARWTADFSASLPSIEYDLITDKALMFESGTGIITLLAPAL
jgi:hypothetical protein